MAVAAPVRELVFDLSGELPSGLAEHGEVPQQRVAALAVGFQLANRDIRGELLGLLRGFDLSVSRRMSRRIDGPGLGQN